MNDFTTNLMDAACIVMGICALAIICIVLFRIVRDVVKGEL